MSAIVTTMGTVKAVHGANPGPASGITYDVEVNLSGIGKVVAQGVVPHHQRWPDIVDTVAANIGDSVAVEIVGKAMHFAIAETASVTECP